MKISFFIEIIKSDDYKKVELWFYQCFIGKLMYITYSTRPDIAFIVKEFSKYNANPENSHM